MLALEWADIDLAKRQLCVRQSDSNGQVSTTKSGRLRYVPLTLRLAATLVEHRHLRSKRVLCQAFRRSKSWRYFGNPEDRLRKDQ